MFFELCPTSGIYSSMEKSMFWLAKASCHAKNFRYSVSTKTPSQSRIIVLIPRYVSVEACKDIVEPTREIIISDIINLL